MNHDGIVGFDLTTWDIHGKPLLVQTGKHSLCYPWSKMAKENTVESLLELIILVERTNEIGHTKPQCGYSAAGVRCVLEYGHGPDHVMDVWPEAKQSEVVDTLGRRDDGPQGMEVNKEDVERMRDVLKRLMSWDMFEGSADGPYWRTQISRALAGEKP